MSDPAIYLDYMSTTPIDPRVIEAMLMYMGPQGVYGNASSVSHEYGKFAAKAIEDAREDYAFRVGCSPQEIIFTSGATESNNLAIIGASTFYERKGRHVVTMMTEHSSVLESFHALEKKGFEVTYLPPRSDGLLDEEVLKKALRNDTVLLSIMHVNNEVGVIQDIKTIGRLAKSKGILFHVDAAQSGGKLAIDLAGLPVDLMSFSAHKMYGPKGVGALFIRARPKVRLFPLTFGGGQEMGWRSGTLATHQIIGMTTAMKIACESLEAETTRLLRWRNQLLSVLSQFNHVYINGSLEHRIAGNLNLCFRGASFEDLSLIFRRFACSMTSACIASKLQPSYVLRAMGLSIADAQSSIRFSLGRFTTDEDIQNMLQFFQEMLPTIGDHK